jgi:Helix-turn-helix domain
VSFCVNCKTWINQGVMQYLIDSANRKTGACYPSIGRVATDLGCSKRAVQRSIRWWLRLRYRVNGKLLPFLVILARGSKKPDGSKESNAYGVGWFTFIACAADRHHQARVRAHSTAILQQNSMEFRGQIGMTQ